MNNKKLILPLLALCVGLPLHAQEEDKVDLTPKVHGTIRGKYEYQTEEGDGRFKLETRVSVLKEKWQKLLNIKQKSTCRMRDR